MALYSGPAAGARAGAGACTINGEAIDIVDSKYDANLIKRETLDGQTGVQGFSVKYKAGKIMLTVRDAGSLTVAEFNKLEDATVVLELVSGKTVSGDGMWSTEISEVNTSEGTFDVTLEGPRVVEN